MLIQFSKLYCVYLTIYLSESVTTKTTYVPGVTLRCDSRYEADTGNIRHPFRCNCQSAALQGCWGSDPM